MRSETLTVAPKGLGGWLVLPLVVLFITPLNIAIGFLGRMVPALREWGWRPVSAAYSGLLGRAPAWLGLEWFAAAALFAGAILLIVLAFRKRKLFPRFALWFYPLITVTEIPHLVSKPPNYVFLTVAVVIGTVAWMLYFLFSRRVKNTFVD